MEEQCAIAFCPFGAHQSLLIVGFECSGKIKQKEKVRDTKHNKAINNTPVKSLKTRVDKMPKSVLYFNQGDIL